MTNTTMKDLKTCRWCKQEFDFVWQKLWHVDHMICLNNKVENCEVMPNSSQH